MPRSKVSSRLVREVAKEATVLLIEHNMPVVMELAHRITVLDRGTHPGRGNARGDPRQCRRAEPPIWGRG